MDGLRMIVPGSFWQEAVGTVGDALVRKTFIGDADRAFWFDPSDMTTLFQDRAGTVPVTAPGQNVSRVKDKSGRGQDMVLVADAAAQPTYQTDGNLHWIDLPLGGFFQIPNAIDFDDRSVVGAVRWTGGSSSNRYLLDQEGLSSASSVAIVCARVSGKFSANVVNDGTYELVGATTIADGTDYVLGYRLNVADQVSQVYVNGNLDGSYSGFPAYQYSNVNPNTRVFHSRTTLSTSGRLYGLAYVREYRDLAPVTAVMAKKAGIAI